MTSSFNHYEYGNMSHVDMNYVQRKNLRESFPKHCWHWGMLGTSFTKCRSFGGALPSRISGSGFYMFTSSYTIWSRPKPEHLGPHVTMLTMPYMLYKSINLQFTVPPKLRVFFPFLWTAHPPNKRELFPSLFLANSADVFDCQSDFVEVWVTSSELLMILLDGFFQVFSPYCVFFIFFSNVVVGFDLGVTQSILRRSGAENTRLVNHWRYKH